MNNFTSIAQISPTLIFFKNKTHQDVMAVHITYKCGDTVAVTPTAFAHFELLTTKRGKISIGLIYNHRV